jgi:hypothetical protein
MAMQCVVTVEACVPDILATHAYPICSRHHVNLQRHTRGPTRDGFVRNMREFARLAALLRLRGFGVHRPATSTA